MGIPTFTQTHDGFRFYLRRPPHAFTPAGYEDTMRLLYERVLGMREWSAERSALLLGIADSDSSSLPDDDLLPRTGIGNGSFPWRGLIRPVVFGMSDLIPRDTEFAEMSESESVSGLLGRVHLQDSDPRWEEISEYQVVPTEDRRLAADRLSHFLGLLHGTDLDDAIMLCVDVGWPSSSVRVRGTRQQEPWEVHNSSSVNTYTMTSTQDGNFYIGETDGVIQIGYADAGTTFTSASMGTSYDFKDSETESEADVDISGGTVDLRLASAYYRDYGTVTGPSSGGPKYEDNIVPYTWSNTGYSSRSSSVASISGPNVFMRAGSISVLLRRWESMSRELARKVVKSMGSAWLLFDCHFASKAYNSETDRWYTRTYPPSPDVDTDSALYGVACVPGTVSLYGSESSASDDLAGYYGMSAVDGPLIKVSTSIEALYAAIGDLGDVRYENGESEANDGDEETPSFSWTEKIHAVHKEAVLKAVVIAFKFRQCVRP